MTEHSPGGIVPAGPRLETPDGRPLSRTLRALRALATRPAPLRRAILYATPRLIAPRLPELVARYPDGRVFYLPADPGPYAQVFTLGEFEPAESAAARRLLRPGDFAVDIGANLGWFTLVMAARVGAGGEVWAIEPMPPILPVLRRNLELNEQLNVRLVELALGSEDGHAELHVFEGLPHGHASISTLDRSDYSTHRVELRTLDGLLEGAPTPAFVKLDAEGSERDVLLGARETLGSERPPIWMIEVNRETAAAFAYRPAELLDLFHERGDYSAYRVAGNGLVPEVEPESAPDGSSWIVAPAGHRDRILEAS